MSGKPQVEQPRSNPQVLTDAEIDQLLLAVFGGPHGGTDEEAAVLLEWAEHVRIDEALLDLALEGKVSISIDPDRVPRFFPRKPAVLPEDNRRARRAVAKRGRRC